MLFIENLTRQLMPEWPADTKLSIACISTTNPVYLVFKQDSSHPALVVRTAVSGSVIKAHEVTIQLFEKVGDLIPEPIAIECFDNQNFAVQRGVTGSPWFQLTQSVVTPGQWDELRRRVLVALSKLHQGISEVGHWKAECNPGQELRNSFEQANVSGITVTDELRFKVEEMSKQLDKLGIIYTYPQHGDFCLNNLIIDAHKIHIIDFEDFGMTSMPLFDEFSLALSMYSQSPKNINTSIIDEIKACTSSAANSYKFDTQALPGLFMHHLFLKLGEWSLGERRKGYREWLLKILDHFSKNSLIE